MPALNPDHPMAHHRRRRRTGLALAVIVCAAVAGGCGGSGGGGGGTLPSSVPGSLPSSLPGSLPSLPTTTRTTSSQPTPPPTETTTVTTETTETTSAPPTSGATGTTAVLQATATTTVTSGQSDTPWGWIVAAAILILIVVIVGAWALGRRGAARRDWSAQARQANGDGAALHDTALAELIAAATANRPEGWSAIASACNELSLSLQRLQTSAPDDAGTRKTQVALDAVGGVRSAVAIASAAPPGQPLDPEAARTMRQRLEDLAVGLRGLTT
jgi:hypothetical protein